VLARLAKETGRQSGSDTRYPGAGRTQARAGSRP
jgi:hypothetical protein